MIAEISLFGVLVNGGLASASVAVLLLFALRRILVACGAYRALWHPALADVALFFLLWGLVAAAEAALGGPLLSFLG